MVMKILALFMFFGLSITSANAAHWECKGAHNLKRISFDLVSDVMNFSVVAPDLDQRDLQKSFVQVNTFTMVANQLLDDRAQETIDYTLIIDQYSKTLQVFSQWSTNNNVDVETIVCQVTELN